MTTQCDEILQFMKQQGRITMADGFHYLGITCTSQRLTDLRKRGYNINTLMTTSESGARYAVWSLGSENGCH